MDIQWPLVLFTVIAGMGSWTFACVGINEFTNKFKGDWPIQVASGIACILLALGGVCSMFHLSHVEHVLWVFQHPAPGIFVEAMFIGVNIVLALLYILMVRRGVEGTPRKVVAGISIAFSFVFTYACGSSYMMSSQTTWMTYTLPLCYMATAMPSGVGVWWIINCAFKAEEESYQMIGREMLIAAAFALVFGTAFSVANGAILSPEHGAAVYWVGILLVGSIVPAVCGLFLVRNFQKVPRMTLGIIATVCAFAGSCCGRIVMYASSVALMSLFGVEI